MGTSIFVLGAIVLLLSFAAVRLYVRWALEREVLDFPNSRSSHLSPVPRGAGLPLVLLLCGSLVILCIADASWGNRFLLTYVLGALLVAGVSWIDDLWSIATFPRLAAHTVAATAVVAGIGSLEQVEFPFWGPFSLGLLGLPLTIIWIIGLINSYNFMDGIDGIAGAQGVIAGLTWAFIGWQIQQEFVAATGFFLACGSLAFLAFNWPPATVFLGDVGSAWLGFSFAILTVAGGLADPRLVLVGVASVQLFVFDSTFTFIRRLWRRENILSAHRSHLYQRLIASGHGHGFVTVVYAFFTASAALSGLYWWSAETILAAVVFTLISLGGCCCVWLLVTLSEWENRLYRIRSPLAGQEQLGQNRGIVQ